MELGRAWPQEVGIEPSGSAVKLLSMPRKALLLANFRSDSGGLQKLSREMRDKDVWLQVASQCSMVLF